MTDDRTKIGEEALANLHKLKPKVREKHLRELKNLGFLTEEQFQRGMAQVNGT